VDAGGESYPGERLLRQPSPIDVYRKISAGDPFRLQERCGRFLRERCYLVEVDRLTEECRRWVAVTSMTYRGDPDLDTWLTERIDLALVHVMREDIEVHMGQGEVPCRDVDDEVFDPRWEFMSDTFGLLPSVAIGAAVRFNALDPRPRKVFFLLAMECRSVQQCLDDGYGPKEKLRSDFHVAAEALLGEPLGIGKPIQSKKKLQSKKKRRKKGGAS